MSKEYTAATFSAALNVPKDIAYGLLRFLVSTGLAKQLEAKRAEGKSGRGENRYEIVETAPEGVSKLLKTAL